jgi:hypothetical protein
MSAGDKAYSALQKDIRGKKYSREKTENLA